MISDWQLPLARGDDWISFVVVLIFVFGGLIINIIKKLSGRNEADQEEPSPPRRTPTPSGGTPQPRPPSADAEEIRKFLEALGKPRTAPPPPPRTAPPPPILRPVQQPQRPPPVPRPTPQRPPAPVFAEGVSEEADEDEEGPRNVITGERTRRELKPLERMDLSQEMQAAEVEMLQTHKLPSTTAQVSATNRAAEFRKLLGDKTDVRRALVLAEILSDPKALR